MPIVINDKGQEKYVKDAELNSAIQEGYRPKYGDIQASTGVGDLTVDTGTARTLASSAPISTNRDTDRVIENYLEDEYGGITGGLSTLGRTAASAATFGATEHLLEDKTRARLSRKQNPGLATAGNVLGIVGPAIATGGQSLVGKAAALTGTGAIGKLAAKAGSATLKKTGSRTFAAAAENAAFGGALEAGEKLSKFVIDGENPFTVESLSDIAGATIRDGLIGGALGAATKGIGAAGRRAKAAKNSQVAEEALEASARGVERVSVASKADDTAKTFDDFLKKEAIAPEYVESVIGVKKNAVKKSLDVVEPLIAQPTAIARFMGTGETASLAAESAIKRLKTVGDDIISVPPQIRQRVIDDIKQVDGFLEEFTVATGYSDRAVKQLEGFRGAILGDDYAKAVTEERLLNIDSGIAETLPHQLEVRLNEIFEQVDELKTQGQAVAQAVAAPEAVKETAKTALKKTKGRGKKGDGWSLDAAVNSMVYSARSAGRKKVQGLGAGDLLAGAAGGFTGFAVKKGIQAVANFANRNGKLTDAIDASIDRLATVGSKPSRGTTAKTIAAGLHIWGDKNDKLSKQVSQAVSDREAYREAVEQALSPLATSHPIAVANAVESRMQRLDYYSRFVNEPPGNPFMPTRSKTNRVDEFRLSSAVLAGEHPEEALSYMLDNDRANPEMIKALIELRPGVMMRFREQLLDKLFEAGKTLPFRKRLSVGRLLGMPIDPSDNPEFTVAIQAMYEARAQESGAQISGQPQVPPATTGQRLATK